MPEASTEPRPAAPVGCKIASSHQGKLTTFTKVALDGLDDSSSDEEIYGLGVKKNKRLDRDMAGAFHQKPSDEGGQIDVSNGKGQVYKRLRKAGKGFENPMLGWEVVFTYR